MFIIKGKVKFYHRKKLYRTSRLYLKLYGDLYEMTATVVPADATDKSVTWSSSNTDTATVSDTGLVIAVNPGTAVIRATCNADATKYAECSVITVAAASVMVGDYI